jgi:hypothetical protein
MEGIKIKNPPVFNMDAIKQKLEIKDKLNQNEVSFDFRNSIVPANHSKNK